MMNTLTRKMTYCILMAAGMTGCQHIQVTKSPIPITLTPNATQQATLADAAGVRTQQPIVLQPTNQPIKNKSDAKKSPQMTEFYLLESWF